MRMLNKWDGRKRLLGRKAAIVGLSVLMGTVLAVAGVGKLFHPAQFLSNVYSYGIVRENAGMAVAAILPWLEIVIGIAILSERLTRPAFLAASALLLIFVFAQVLVLASGTVTACGCALLPHAEEVISAWTIARTGALAAMAGAGYVLTFPLRLNGAAPGAAQHVVCATVIAGLVLMPSPAHAMSQDENGAHRISEAADRLSAIYLENYPIISSYMRGAAIAPEAELQRIDALAARWLSEMGRGLRAGTIEFPLPEGGFLRASGVPISHLNVAGEMLVFQARISSRGGDLARAGTALGSACDLMTYLRGFGSVSTAGTSHHIAKELAEFASDRGVLDTLPRSSLVLLHNAVESLPADDPFGRLAAFQGTGREFMAWAAASRKTAAGADFLQLVADNMHPSLQGMLEMTEAEFAGAAALTDLFFEKVNAAARLPDAADAAAALAQLSTAAQAGEYGPFAVVMTDRQYYDDLAKLRGKMDEGSDLVERLIASLKLALEADPAQNAAEFYLAATAVVREVEDAGLDLANDDARKFVDDIVVLMQRGSECDWCDFSTVKDMTSFIMPEYAPGLRKCIQLVHDKTSAPNETDSIQRAIELLRIAKHLAGDGTIASSDLAFQAFRNALEVVSVHDPGARAKGVVVEGILIELKEMDARDPLGWNASVGATRLALRGQWSPRAPEPPDPDWRAFGSFLLSSDPPLAWAGLLGLLTAEVQGTVLGRITEYCREPVELARIHTIANRARELIDQNNQQALAHLEGAVFYQLFSTSEMRDEAWSRFQRVVQEMTAQD